MILQNFDFSCYKNIPDPGQIFELDLRLLLKEKLAVEN